MSPKRSFYPVRVTLTPPGPPVSPLPSLPPVAPTPPAPAIPETQAGWYADPWAISQWRWWDGWAWTGHVSGNPAKKPMLPGWLSWAVVVGMVFAVPLTIFLAIGAPLAIGLAFIPLFVVGPVLWWLDRIEPEPLQSRVHAFLWGGTISGVVAGTINSIVFATSGETWGAVVSAPLSEEIMKALGIIWALRRKEIDSVMDGVVYAGWVALGFAVVENFLYFSDAASQGELIPIVIVRGFLTPFAHPLFTAWTGLAIGWAVSRRTSVAASLTWGLPLAILSHAAWNGSLVYAEEDGRILLIAIPGFILLFLTAGLAVTLIRRREQAHFLQLVPLLAQRYGLSAQEVAVFGHWKTMLDTRKRLPRGQRKAFDNVHGNLARLAALHNRPGKLDSVAEGVLVNRLQRARRG